MNTNKKKLGTTVAANTATVTAEEQSFINPFSIASRKDSEHNSEGEVTAEGFYKGPMDTLGDQSSKLANHTREDQNTSVLSVGGNSRSGAAGNQSGAKMKNN